MHLFELLAERKIEDAVSRGDLDHLYRMLKNAGFVPPEVAQAKAGRKLALLRTRIERGYSEKVVGKLSR